MQNLWSQSDVVSGSFLQPATFAAVRSLLGFFMPNVIADSATFLIGTPRYTFFLGYGCAGMEGLGLVFVFTSVWLWVSRKECRFPQSLLLIPCALLCIWVLNVVRLCALVVIGNAGFREVAEIGFHSRFGWISFTAVALIFSMLTQRLSWVRKTASPPPSGALEAVDDPGECGEVHGESAATSAFLLPFLAILAATFVSKAASGSFEWLYPLRFVAAVIVLYFFWPELKKLNWRFGWFGPVAGAAVFVVWIAPAWLSHQHAVTPLGAELAALTPTARWAWIAIRVAAAVVTVPIAEELAFRGYLARRFISRDFDHVSFSSLTILSICLSSAVFGLEHMKDMMDWQHLLLGTFAGLAFAAALRWRGRIGDAVVAHAVSNLLLAAWVLGLGDWAQW
jgi:exosortase E/protease (VPEID-CTERM system)